MLCARLSVRCAMRARAGVASSRSFASINLQDDAADVAASPAQQLCTPLTDGTVDVAPAISAALDMRALASSEHIEQVVPPSPSHHLPLTLRGVTTCVTVGVRYLGH